MRLSGFTIIESVISVAIISLTITGLASATAKTVNLSTRNNTNLIAVNVLSSYIENDATAPFSGLLPGTQMQFGISVPPSDGSTHVPASLNDLPEATLIKTITAGPETYKLIKYHLTWKTVDGQQFLDAAYRITPNGTTGQPEN